MNGKALPSVFYTLITVLVVNLVLAAMAWVVGWPSIDSATMFFLGIATMVIAYLLDASLFGKNPFKENEAAGAFEHVWRYRWRRYIFTSPSRQKRDVDFDKLEPQENLPADPELETARKQSALLINISLAGAVAAILSFILPRLF